MSHDRTYNQRQLKLMLEAIESFRKGNSGIGKLISDLDALVSCLRNTDESWKKAFASNWGKLEDIHAALQGKVSRNLKGSDSETVATAVAELTSLIQSEISE
jgi:hypothetical protein